MHCVQNDKSKPFFFLNISHRHGQFENVERKKKMVHGSDWSFPWRRTNMDRNEGIAGMMSNKE